MVLGWSLEEVVAQATVAPARAMGVLGEIGTLAVGACADVAIFDLQSGVFDFEDSARWLALSSGLIYMQETLIDVALFSISEIDG